MRGATHKRGKLPKLIQDGHLQPQPRPVKKPEQQPVQDVRDEPHLHGRVGLVKREP